MKIGIAILPDRVTTEALMALQSKLDERYPIKTKFGKEKYLPHITLMQGDINEARNLDLPIHLIAERSEAQSPFLYEEIYCQPIGWVFLPISNDCRLQNLHQMAFEMMKPKLLPPQNVSKSTMLGYTEPEKKNFLQYGYRYIGNCFRPHVTLARNVECGQYLAELAREISERHPLPKFIPTKITVYEAGPDGSHQTIIVEHSI